MTARRRYADHLRRGGPVRSAALSVNAVGMGLGTCAGASLGGAGLALFGYHGIAAALLFPWIAAIAVGIAMAASPRGPASGPPMQRSPVRSTVAH